TPPSPETEIASAVREVWRLAGRGGYGDPGRVAVVQWRARTPTPASVDPLYAMVRERAGRSSSGSDVSIPLGAARAAGHAPAGHVVALLDADLREASADLAGLRATAQAALRQTAATLADRLLAEASVEPPTRFILRLDGQTLEITVGQPLDPQMSELDAAVE